MNPIMYIFIWMEWSGEWYTMPWASSLYMVNSVELMVAHTAGEFLAPGPIP